MALPRGGGATWIAKRGRLRHRVGPMRGIASLAWIVRPSRRWLLLAAVFMALACVDFLVVDTGRIADRAGDVLLKLNAQGRPASDRVVIVDIDQRSLEAMNDQAGSWPWPRSVHGELIDAIAAQHPRAIVFDVLFNELDVYRPDEDRALGRRGRASSGDLAGDDAQPGWPGRVDQQDAACGRRDPAHQAAGRCARAADAAARDPVAAGGDARGPDQLHARRRRRRAPLSALSRSQRLALPVDGGASHRTVAAAPVVDPAQLAQGMAARFLCRHLPRRAAPAPDPAARRVQGQDRPHRHVGARG